MTWIDALRGFAVLGMIEAHVLNTFLRSGAFAHEVQTWVDYLNGLVAPIFLFIAGYVQGLSTKRAVERHLPVITVGRLKRLGWILLIGYTLHLPWDALERGAMSQSSWLYWWQVDVLQCLAVSLLMLLFAGAIFRRYALWFVAVLLLSCVWVSPFVTEQNWPMNPFFMFLTRQHGSLFPLFPWFAFCAAGHLVSHWQVRPGWQLLSGLLLFAVGELAGPSPFSSAHPAFFIERLGWVLVAVGGARVLTRYFEFGLAQMVGREALLIYVLHLICIYTLPLAKHYGGQLDVLPTLMLYLLITLGCIVAAAWKDRRQQPRVAGQPVTTA